MPRQIKISAVSFRLGSNPAPKATRWEQAFRYLEGAIKDSPDLILLPETFEGMNGMEWEEIGQIEDFEERYAAVMEFAESEDGQLATRLRDFAVKHRVVVVSNNLIRCGDKVFNQATFWGRQGEILGRYRKVQPTEREFELYGISAGDEIEPIQIEDVRYGVFICNDQAFPEICQIYALQGAQVLLHPTQAAGPTETIRSEMLRTRAHDSSCFVVVSSFVGGEALSWQDRESRAVIYDFNGYSLADTGHRDGHCTATLNLDEQRWTSWCHGIDHRRSILRQHRADLFARYYADLSSRVENMIPPLDAE